MYVCVEAIRVILATRGSTTARKLARVTGLLISMAVVLGPSRVYATRTLSMGKNWDSKCRISIKTAKELRFWRGKSVEY